MYETLIMHLDVHKREFYVFTRESLNEKETASLYIEFIYMYVCMYECIYIYLCVHKRGLERE